MKDQSHLLSLSRRSTPFRFTSAAEPEVRLMVITKNLVRKQSVNLVTVNSWIHSAEMVPVDVRQYTLPGQRADWWSTGFPVFHLPTESRQDDQASDTVKGMICLRSPS